MRVQVAIGAGLVAVAAAARLPRNWNATTGIIVRKFVTTTVSKDVCTLPEPDATVTTVTTLTLPPATVSVTVPQSSETIVPTGNPEAPVEGCPAPEAGSNTQTIVSSEMPMASSETPSQIHQGTPSPSQRSTRTVTVSPVPLSEYTAMVTSTSTDFVTYTLDDVPSPLTQPGSVSQVPQTEPGSQVSEIPAPPTIITPSTLRSTTYRSTGWNATGFAPSTTEDSPGPGTIIPSLVKKRQVGATVVATINGEVVSWINDYDGSDQFSDQTASAPSSHRSTPGLLDPMATSSTSIKPTSITTGTISSRSSIPTKCGESGEFTFDFDDLPGLSAKNNDTASFPVIFNPHHHFYFSNGWSYGPPPTEPYRPLSKPHLGIYIPSSHPKDRGSPYAGLQPGGSFGAGPRAPNNVYWFDAYSAYFGCDSPKKTCKVTVSAAKYSADIKKEKLFATRTFDVPPCAARKNCDLSAVDFGSAFRGISSIQFSAIVDDKPVMFFIGDIKMNWYNNTCAAGLERIRTR
ncbi:hypothetical protein FQN55_000400 [Onygenales sp. PD_40]|nr:hypothetical protein FQN55_000400 [Onygenales sp. PD_40]KAK2760156.1 hypothetical protein FQN53_007940 [Emmonsiellopsis sp. PD_33]KAK2783332.1 hypothetical protein FQN51_004438 [Onygenales sp. PD_10]KAK2792241.1 hypothetical protein FQN52_003718 [Onygenales sp. PD_12]